MKTLLVPQVLHEAGLNVVTVDGWDDDSTYRWRSGDPEASMWHHTATGSYAPNATKANMYAGLAIDAQMSDGRLYQTGGGVPVICVANAYPAPISSGYGQEQVFGKARNDVPNDLLATGPDDDWAGNRSYWNTEIVLDGVGTWIDDAVWDAIVRAARAIHRLFGWSEHRAIGHAQHTRRKIDPRDGRHPSARETMNRLRDEIKEDTMPTEQWHQMIDALFAGRPDEFTGNPDYWKNEVPKDSPEWADFWAAFVRAISLEA